MKAFSLIALIVASLLVNEARAQQFPNGGFESWLTYSYGELPAGASGMRWTSNDTLIASYNAYAPNKAIKKVEDAHSGSYALCIQEGYIYIPSNGYKDSGGGVVFLGEPNFVTFRPKGVSYTARPISISGFFKHTATIPGADTSTISAVFMLSGSAIGEGEQFFHTATPSYQAFSIPITWNSSSQPDMLEFRMDNGGADRICKDTSTRFFVDDLMFNFPNGVQENLFPEDGFQTYPNPTTDFVTVKLSTEYARPDYSLTIHDIEGKLVSRHGIKTLQQISLNGYADGVYFIQLRDNTGKVLSGNRITVHH